MPRKSFSSIDWPKSDEYYLGLDLRSLARKIRQFDGPRAEAPEMGVAVRAIIARADHEVITGDDLLSLLGEPDGTEICSSVREIWTYRWQGRSDWFRFVESTPFIVRRGRVIGVRCEPGARDLIIPRSRRGRRRGARPKRVRRPELVAPST